MIPSNQDQTLVFRPGAAPDGLAFGQVGNVREPCAGTYLKKNTPPGSTPSRVLSRHLTYSPRTIGVRIFWPLKLVHEEPGYPGFWLMTNYLNYISRWPDCNSDQKSSSCITCNPSGFRISETGSQALDADADPPGPHRGQTFFLIMGRDNSASGETLARLGRPELEKWRRVLCL